MKQISVEDHTHKTLKMLAADLEMTIPQVVATCVNHGVVALNKLIYQIESEMTDSESVANQILEEGGEESYFKAQSQTCEDLRDLF